DRSAHLSGDRRRARLRAQRPGLNRDGIPAPRRKWAMTGVREMVFRDLYRGQIVYGKTRRIDKGGSTKKRHDRPAAERLTLDAPDLRIVSAELWRAAHDR